MGGSKAHGLCVCVGRIIIKKVFRNDFVVHCLAMRPGYELVGC